MIFDKKEEQTGIEPVTLGPAIPRSTTELLFLTIIFVRSILICTSLKTSVKCKLKN